MANRGGFSVEERKSVCAKNEELRVEIIWLYHDILVAGHRGEWKTMKLVMRNYWWSKVIRDVGKYVNGYDMCQKMKNQIEILVGKPKLSEVLEKLWIYLMVDIITKLPLVARKNVILVISDRLSKMIYFIATTEGTLVEELEQLFRDNVWMLHRLPESMVSDRGPQFAVELIKELNRILGIETKLLISFYLQIDRQTEQINQKLEEYLWFFVGHRQKYWPE